MRILYIEDTKELAYTIKEGLEKAGFYVDLAFDGNDGEEKAFVNQYDVIILDLSLPEKDGLEVLKFLRKERIDTPIIIATGRNDVEEVILGLDLGADDYISKPFNLIELRARIHAVVRRFNGRTNPKIILGSLVICPESRSVTYKDNLIKLSPKEFDILEYLTDKYPKVVSSEEISEHVYDENHDPFSSVLRVHFARLRKKLKETYGYDVLTNIRGKGYTLWIK